MSHTPGPWNYDDPDGKVRSDEGIIASVWNWCIPGQEGIRDANARLIAAAPELLETLKNLCAVPRAEGWPATEAAKRVIAKATGGAR